MSERDDSREYTRYAFHQYEHSRYPDKRMARLAALQSIGLVIKAFEGIFTRRQIIKAIGKAKNPNAVSRAVRNCLPQINYV